MDFRQLMTTLQSDNGLKQVMQRPAFDYGEDEFGNTYDHQFSQADLICDVINILRMDTARIARAHGIDVSINMMTPGRAAELLQGVAKGEDMGLIEVLDEIEDKRMRILAELEGDGAVVEYQEQKQGILHSVPEGAPLLVPETIDEESIDESVEAAADGGEEDTNDGD